MLRVRTPWIFTLTAGVYEAITAQDVWRAHCGAMAALVRGRRVLDLGIGPGVSGIELVRAAPATAVVGIDTSATMLQRARANGAAAGVSVALVRADAAALPFPDASYDGATGHSFLYLLPDAERVLREVHRVVRPGGAVAFLEPNGVSGATRRRAVRRAFSRGARFGTSMLLWSVFSALHGRYTPATLMRQLARAGFAEPRVAAAFDGLGLVASARRP